MRICRIIAGGRLDKSAVETGKDDLVICADSGYASALELGIKPDIIVGDFDSYEGDLPDDAEILRSVPEKDDTDTMLAIRTAIDRGCDRICIYGATGGRFDHTIANLQSLVFIHNAGKEGFIIDENNIITVCGAGDNRFPKKEGWYFSVFAATDVVLIKSMTGVKYPLFDYPMKISYPIGVSNEITGSEAVLKITSGAAFIVRSKMK